MQKIIFILLLLQKIVSIGNSCRQIIQEHYFDLSLLYKIDSDYSIKANDDSFEIFFNFCQYQQHTCNQNPSRYFISIQDQQRCDYFREQPDDTSYTLINEKNKQLGLQINYSNVNDNGESITIKLYCKPQQENLIFDPIKIIDKNYQINVYSKNACPQILGNVIYNFIDKFKWVFFIFGIILGPLELLFGAKIFGITVFFLGFLLSNGILVLIADIFVFQHDSSVYLAYFILFCCLIVSIIAALILVQLKQLGIIVCGATGGFFVCVMLNYLVFWRITSQPSYLFFYDMLFVFTCLGAILSYEFKDHIIILTTSLIGSYILVRSVSLLLGGFPNEFQLNLNINTQTLTDFPWQFYVYFITIIILFILGVLFQLKQRHKDLNSVIKNEKLVNLLEKANRKIEENNINIGNKQLFQINNIFCGNLMLYIIFYILNEKFDLSIKISLMGR